MLKIVQIHLADGLLSAWARPARVASAHSESDLLIDGWKTGDRWLG